MGSLGQDSSSTLVVRGCLHVLRAGLVRDNVFTLLVLSTQTPRPFPSPYWSNRSPCKYGGRYGCSLERLACDRDLLLAYIVGGKTEPSLHVPETHHWAINIYEDLVGSDGFYHNYICGMRNQRFTSCSSLHALFSLGGGAFFAQFFQNYPAEAATNRFR